ncbi:MAG: hypothetical protein JWR22_3022 [Herminiimonas sp.]|nr:hypothetical protein [Herminiimonas sp.]
MLQDHKARNAGATPLRIVRRGVVLLAVSLLLHVLIVDWAAEAIGVPFLQDRQQSAIVVELHSPAPKVRATPIIFAATAPSTPRPVTPPRKPAARLKPAPDAALQSAPVAFASSDSLTAALETPADPIAQDDGEVTAAVPLSEPATPTVPIPEAAKAVDRPDFHFDPPPSAELKYDVQALREGQTVYGNGAIKWVSSGGTYTVHGEAGVLFFTVLDFDSSGEIDKDGVGPALYSEKRFRRAQTNTHFHRDRNLISFSASTVTYPRKGGEQDRASIVWQLSALGRGDTSKFVPGVELEFFVAGVRDGEPWRMRIVGQEDIEVGGTRMQAWHVVRLPKPGSYDQKIDIWFAPMKQWYPVKIRYTETNGEYLDMALSAVHPVESR